MNEKLTTARTKKTTPEFRKGESLHSKSGFQYRWTDENGNRRTIHASTLEELRQKETELGQNRCDKIKPEARNVTVNEMYELWKQLKRGLKDNTFQNYCFMYDQYVAPRLGKQRISALVKSDVKRFYNTLVDERGFPNQRPMRKTAGSPRR